MRLLSPVTVAAISARHRTDMLDETYGVVMDWGLGLVVDWYATGRYSSRRAFGHGGHQSSVAFCDPEHDLVVAVVCNGMPGRERHSARSTRSAARSTSTPGSRPPATPDAASRSRPRRPVTGRIPEAAYRLGNPRRTLAARFGPEHRSPRPNQSQEERHVPSCHARRAARQRLGVATDQGRDPRQRRARSRPATA